MTKKLAIILLLFVFCGFAYAGERVSLSGYVKTEVALREESANNALDKLKNTIELSGEYKIKDDELVFFMKAKYWYDAAYGLSDKMDIGQHYNGHIQRNDWLRDCYLDYTTGPWFLRLGKQQVAWGQADGVTILDRVNPVDLTEFWLLDMTDIRIPLWMANINYAPKLNANLQFLVIPDFEQSTVAYLGGPFTLYSFKRYDALKKVSASVNENIYFPGKQFENSTFGFQWSDRIGDLEYTLNYLNGFYYSARNTTIFLGAGPGGANLKVDRAFKRWRMYGTSFNKTFTRPGLMQGITLRGDFAYYNDEPTYVGDPVAGSSRIKRYDNKFWLIGAEKAVFTKWLISFQFSQYILEHAKDKASGRPTQQSYAMNAFTNGPADAVDNIFSLKISTNFMNDRLKPEVLWSFTDDSQGRLSPKLTYEIKDNLFVSFGLHYFYGNEWDSNGQFRDQNQVYTSLKYTF